MGSVNRFCDEEKVGPVTSGVQVPVSLDIWTTPIFVSHSSVEWYGTRRLYLYLWTSPPSVGRLW